MQIKKFVFNPFSENTYLVWDESTLEALIVDPGCQNIHEEQIIQKFIVGNNLTMKYVVNTHGHLDHIFGNYFLKSVFPEAALYVPEPDLPLLERGKEQAKVFGVSFTESPLPDYYLTEETVLTLGDEKFSFLFTPGHTPGEYSLLNENNNICFSGDVLFKESIGRTDLWGGNLQVLENSIKTKLFTLNDNVVVYPGHGDATSIGYEKMNNPFFY